MVKLIRKKFIYKSLENYFTYTKTLKIHQLNIIKIIKNDYKKQLVLDIKVFLRKKKKKATI